MTRLFYPDVNVVHLLEEQYRPERFDALAGQLNCKLALGVHVVYELARGYLYDHHIERVRHAFVFLTAISRRQLWPTENQILDADFYYLMTGIPLPPRLTPGNDSRFRRELERLAGGHRRHFKDFIQQRDKRVKRGHRDISAANTAEAAAYFGVRPEDRKEVKAFVDFKALIAANGADLELLRGEAASRRLSPSDALMKNMISKPHKFRAVATWLGAQLYLAWIAGTKPEKPSFDKLDDYRHLLAASWCDLFVTNEKGLVRRAREMRPAPPAISWAEFDAAFSRGLWPWTS